MSESTEGSSISTGSTITPERNEAETTRFTILRHAPTTYNREGRIQGNIQSEVDPEAVLGWWEKTAPNITSKPDLIVASGLKRTAQTANIILEKKGWQVPVVNDPRLNERKWGILEGLTHDEARELLAKDYPEARTIPDLSDLIDSPGFRVEGAEAPEEVAERARLALWDIADKYPGKNIMIVGHLGVMKFLGLDSKGINRFILRSDKAREVEKDSSRETETQMPHELMVVFGQGPVKPLLLQEQLDVDQSERWEAFKKDPLHSSEPDFRVVEGEAFLKQLEGLDEAGKQQKLIEWQKMGRFGLNRWGRQNALASGFALLSGYTEKLLLSGGKTIPPWAKEKLPKERVDNWPSEAQLMADIIRRRFGAVYERIYGKPIESALFVEGDSTNTLENLAYSINKNPKVGEGNVGILAADFHTDRAGRISYLFSPSQEANSEYSAQEIMAQRRGTELTTYRNIIEWMTDPKNQEFISKSSWEDVWNGALEDPELLNYWLGYIGIAEDPRVLQKTIDKLGDPQWRDRAIDSFRQAGLDFGLLEKTSLIAIDPREFQAIAEKLRILATPEYRAMPQNRPPQTITKA